jgi:hypothetical protein
VVRPVPGDCSFDYRQPELGQGIDGAAGGSRWSWAGSSPRSAFEWVEYFPGSQPEAHPRAPEVEAVGAEAAGLEVVELRNDDYRCSSSTWGAVVYFFRKVVWMVPDFTVDAYRDRLRQLHHQIQLTTLRADPN